MKSTVEQIRERFDQDVERFSNLETGQSATMDAPLVLDVITSVAAAATPSATTVLDVGCGAGNFTLKLLQKLPGRECVLLDLSRPMLDRAEERVSSVGASAVRTIQGDIRDVDLGTQAYDVILAGAVLHHLRSAAEWRLVYQKLHDALRPGGSLWVFDLVSHSSPAVQRVLWQRYGEYLVDLKGEAYRDQVFAYIEQEDTPAPLLEQIRIMESVGFREIDILHKNACFAAFGGKR